MIVDLVFDPGEVDDLEEGQAAPVAEKEVGFGSCR
jgi:hypothetical protein